MHSMTGYGSYSRDTGSLQIDMRIRSVNHRNLDMVLRMPEEYRYMELEVRRRIGTRLHRGRIELRLDVEDRRDFGLRVIAQVPDVTFSDQRSRVYMRPRLTEEVVIPAGLSSQIALQLNEQAIRQVVR